MCKLLSANFSRLWKDKIFWLCMGTMLIYSVDIYAEWEQTGNHPLIRIQLQFR